MCLSMSEMTSINAILRPLPSSERWRAAVTACDVADGAAQAVYYLHMLGLIEPGPGGEGYVPGGTGQSWYPPSPFTLPYVKSPTVVAPLQLLPGPDCS